MKRVITDHSLGGAIAEIATILARLPAEGRLDVLQHAQRYDRLWAQQQAAQSAQLGQNESKRRPKAAPRGGNVVAFPGPAGGAA